MNAEKVKNISLAPYSRKMFARRQIYVLSTGSNSLATPCHSNKYKKIKIKTINTNIKNNKSYCSFFLHTKIIATIAINIG